MTKIIVDGIMCKANMGVQKEERKRKQRIDLSIEIDADLKKAQKSDHVKDTIDYSELIDCVRQKVAEKEYKLIEKLGEELLCVIYKRFNKKWCSIKKITVNIQKPEIAKKKQVKSIGMQFEMLY